MTVEIPAALQNRFEAEVRAAYKEHEKESRRNLEIRTAFCATLSALGAGSIAVAASIGMALTAKPQLLSGSLHATAHGLVVITFFLWVSLVCAVMHNFLVVHIAKLESEYSGHEFVRTIIRRAFAMVRDGGPAESLGANVVTREYAGINVGRSCRRSSAGSVHHRAPLCGSALRVCASADPEKYNPHEE